MAGSGPNTAICTYRIKKGKEAAFLRLLSRHWPTLRRLGLVTAEKPLTYRGRDEGKGTVILDIFTWKSAKAVDIAHRHPEVMALWERMDPLTEERMGRPKWEFPHYEPLRLKPARG